jgi:hypothetical protein
MMDAHGIVQDFVLGLPELHGQHSGVNIAGVVVATLTNFGINKDSVGYIVLDNAYNNDTAVASPADLYEFETPDRRLRCYYHILNLGAQVIIRGRIVMRTKTTAAALRTQSNSCRIGANTGLLRYYTISSRLSAHPRSDNFCSVYSKKRLTSRVSLSSSRIL